MPRKQQGWITFKSSDAERQLLEQYCQQVQRTKTEVLRELLRSLGVISSFSDISMIQGTPNVGELMKQVLEHQAMKISARNTIKGTIKKVIIGAVNAEVTLEIAPGVEVVSIITKSSAESLGLTEGKEAYAVIKASEVMIAID